MGALETYLTAVRDTKLSGEGVSELSYYPALHALLEEVGGKLKPKVRCFMNLRNQGAGLPDGGLFTADQVRGSRAAKGGATGAAAPAAAPDLGALGGQKPARGAIEVKPPSADIHAIAASAQVHGYLAAYRQVLVTNLREFLLLGHRRPRPARHPRALRPGADRGRVLGATAAHPRRTELEQGERFLEFLKRVLLSGARWPRRRTWPGSWPPTPARPASWSRSADLPALDAVRAALEEAWASSSRARRASTSSAPPWCRPSSTASSRPGSCGAASTSPATIAPPASTGRGPPGPCSVPVIRPSSSRWPRPASLGRWAWWRCSTGPPPPSTGWIGRAFFSRFEEHHAVQYFYEPFLEAFDPELRKELGVWYTPPEIVEYMVARVDTVLREELDVPDGLADPRVYVLDPCCGTGAYLVEVLERIAQTLDEKGGDALSAGDVKKAAMEPSLRIRDHARSFRDRAPAVGLLLLQNMHRPLEPTSERVAVFLTNALTGWEIPHGHAAAACPSRSWKTSATPPRRSSANCRSW